MINIILSLKRQITTPIKQLDILKQNRLFISFISNKSCSGKPIPYMAVECYYRNNVEKS